MKKLTRFVLFVLFFMVLGLWGSTLADVDDGGSPDVGYAPSLMLADVDDGGSPDVGSVSSFLLADVDDGGSPDVG